MNKKVPRFHARYWKYKFASNQDVSFHLLMRFCYKINLVYIHGTNQIYLKFYFYFRLFWAQPRDHNGNCPVMLAQHIEFLFAAKTKPNTPKRWRKTFEHLRVGFSASENSAKERFHMGSWRPYWCFQTMKRRTCWCSKPILCESNCFRV